MNNEKPIRGVNIFDIIQPKEEANMEKKISFEDLIKKRQKKEVLVKYFKELSKQLNNDQDEVKYKSSSDDD